ncbi:hypothetical protein tb265_31920 [Gemmatimonadetes bacterium T265]|nr:hypothetical protein tb265_31920 [Gemmatimonadetes bacterium T265]
MRGAPSTPPPFAALDGARTLRRADWRWLLPRATFDRVLCLDAADLAASARSIARELGACVDRATVDNATAVDTYDLVLAARTDARTLGRARVALRADGVLYVEGRAGHARGVPGGVRGLRARLAAAGFADVQPVAPWPAVGSALAWFPVDPPAAGARYLLLRHPLPARHPLRRLWIAARRRAALARLAAGRPGEVVAVARAPAAPDPIAPWWAAAVPNARPGDWVVLTPGRVDESRVVGMLILPRGRRPAAVVKLGRTPDARRRMARGADVLDVLRAAGFTADRRAPAPLGRLRDADGELVAAAEVALPGRWLDTALRARTLVAYTEAATDWLIALALATRGPARDDTWARSFAPVFRRFARACGAVVDRVLLDEAAALLASVPPTPTVLAHGDFRPWNVYVGPGRRLAAFDWDGGRADGLPLLDLLHGHAALGFTLDRALGTGRFAASRRRRDAGAPGRARRDGAARYARAVGVSDHAARAVRAFAWMDLSADEADTAREAGRPVTRADLPRTYLGLWEDEARAALA